jgi:hypothetical protein
MWCRVCSLHKKTRSALYFCRKCNGGLCVVAYACESPLHIKRRVDCVDVRQIVSLYSADRKHLPYK